jgi:hypothetical protein
MIKAKALKSKTLSAVYIVMKDESESRYDLEHAKKTIKTTKTQVILDRINCNKKRADIDFFLITYVRSRASKSTGSTSKQGNNNNNQTQAPSALRAETSETPVSVPRTAPA